MVKSIVKVREQLSSCSISKEKYLANLGSTPQTEISDSNNIVSEEEHGYPSGITLFFIVAALLLSIFLAALDMTIIATAVPRITDEFHSIDQVGWYGSAFFLTLAVFQSFWGKLYRYCNLKYTFLAAGVVFELGSLICGTSRDSTSLIVGRAIQGIGAAGIYCGCYTIIAFIAPPSQTPRYMGLIGVSYAAASVAGPLLGGFFSDTISWRWCFYINLPIGGFSLALILLSFSPPASAKPVPISTSEILLQLQIPGAVVIMAALVCFLLATQWAGVTRDWTSSSVLTCLVLSGILALLFLAIQMQQGERASLVPRLLHNRTIIGISTFAFFQNGINFFFCYYIPLYFQSIEDFSASKSGIYILPLNFGACLFAIISGFLITSIDYFTSLMAIGSMMCTIAAGLIYTVKAGTPLSRSIGYQVLFGAGQGLAIQVPVIVGQASSLPEDISATTAIILFFQMLGGAVCISAGQSIFANRLLLSLKEMAPQVDAARVLAIGASDLRRDISPDRIELVLTSYMIGIQYTFALGIALAGCAFLSSWIAPVKRLRDLGGLGPEIMARGSDVEILK